MITAVGKDAGKARDVEKAKQERMREMILKNRRFYKQKHFIYAQLDIRRIYECGGDILLGKGTQRWDMIQLSVCS